MAYILALRQGTTSSKALLFNPQGEVKGVAQQPVPQIVPQSGWVAAIGICNQRETTLVWDRISGEPLWNALVWQDRRTTRQCQDLPENLIKERTGLVPDACFSATKIAWILDNIELARSRAEAGELAFGTVDSWLLWKLTEGLHVTDVSNASRTVLFNLETLDWDEELLDLFGIPRSLMPEVRSSSEVCGHTAEGVLPARIPVASLVGNQQASLFGQLCFSPGLCKCSYETGAFILMNTGRSPTPTNKLLTTAGWGRGDTTDYALEGNVFLASAALDWLRGGLGMVRTLGELEWLAAQVPDTGGVYFVPAFNGLGSPYWNPQARGTLIGLSRETTAAHVVRAALEGLAFQVVDIVEAMAEAMQNDPSELRVDGSLAEVDLLMQMQADVLGIPTVRPHIADASALGAAYLAGLAIGCWSDLEQLQHHPRPRHDFLPVHSPTRLAESRERWKRAVDCADRWGRV